MSAAEALFEMHLKAHRIPFEREFRFHPTRRWRFDFALVEHKVAVEIEGGIWRRGGGAHSRPKNIERDLEKHNAATALGWRVFRFMPDKHVQTGVAIETVREAIGA